MKQLFSFFIILFFLNNVFSQGSINSRVTITGQVINSKTNRTMSGVNVYASDGEFVVTTNDHGYYSIRCDTSSYLLFTLQGYEDEIVKVGSSKTINVSLCYGGYSGSGTGKPVIYLYPEKTSQVNLQFNYQGKLQTTYPQYANGWNVEAQPNGVLHTADGKEYSYLFWDGLKQYTKQELSYNSGFFVAGDSALQFLQRILPQTGLLPKEYNEFIVYWLPLMQANKLNFVHFRLQDDYSVISTNTVSPKPDVEIRVFMEFKAVDKALAIKPQKINTPTRHGFTLVEWGGSEIRDDIQINETYIGYKP